MEIVYEIRVAGRLFELTLSIWRVIEVVPILQNMYGDVVTVDSKYRRKRK